MKSTALLLLSAALVAPATSGAPTAPEAPPVVRLGVDDAVSRALLASPRLARLGALEAAAEAQRRGATADRWPQVDVTAGYQRRSAVPELTIQAPTGDPTNPVQTITVFPNIEDNYRLRAGLALPLYTGGRVSSQIEAAGKGREAAQQDLKAARADLVLEATSAYWGLVTARAGERVLQEAIKAFEAHLTDARNREKFGMAARNEVLAVQVERDRTELDRLRASVAAEVAEANLRRLLDLPPSTRVEATEALEAPPVAAVEIEALVAEAAAARADRAAVLARASAAEALIGVERGGRLPQVALTAGYTYANPNRDIVPPTATWKTSWDVGAALSWSVLDGGKRSAGEARARAQADAAREQLRELDRAIRLEVTQRALELRTAEERVVVADRGLEAARENHKVAQDRYREGVIPSSELLDAETALERADLARTEALASLRLAAAGLDRAVGR
jgi:outer membrane protein TolC